MRFTILTQYYLPEVGAPQIRLSALARTLQKQGHEVQVVTAMPNYPGGIIQQGYRGKWWMREVVEGVPVIRTWIYPATGQNILKRLANYFSFTFTCIFSLLSIPRADFLFVESPPLFLCLSAWLIAILRGQRLCINISDLWPDSVVALDVMKEGTLVQTSRWLEKWLYRQAWLVCGATDGIVKGIIAKGIAPEKVLFLPNGVDTNRFQTQPYLQTTGQPFQFIYAGTHGYAHGVDVILYAADRLRHRKDIEFILVGDGADKARLVDIATKLDLRNITFLNPVPPEEIPKLLASAFAALVTIRKGNFFSGTRSAKIFPAMASSRAILHSGDGEGGNLVKHAKCGLLIPPEDPEALAKAILFLVDNPDEAREMGRRGREFVEQEYSWEIIVHTWLQQVLREKLSENRHDYRRPASVH